MSVTTRALLAVLGLALLTCHEAKAGGPVFSQCDRADLPTDLRARGFEHRGNGFLSWFGSGHSASDSIAVTGHVASIEGKFAYGPMSKDLEDERVELWLDLCGEELVHMDTIVTNGDGRAHFVIDADELPEPGSYQVIQRVVGDGTSVSSTLKVYPPGTQLVVFDIDGTLTDGKVSTTPRDMAAEATLKRGGEENYELIYLTARHYLLTAPTRQWLLGQGVAKGSLVLTQSLWDFAPGQGEYKAEFLESLVEQGLHLEAAYGDSATDIDAYLRAGISPQKVYMLGDEGGNRGTVALGSGYREHLESLRGQSPASQPFTR